MIEEKDGDRLIAVGTHADICIPIHRHDCLEVSEVAWLASSPGSRRSTSTQRKAAELG